MVRIRIFLTPANLVERIYMEDCHLSANCSVTEAALGLTINLKSPVKYQEPGSKENWRTSSDGGERKFRSEDL